MDALVHEAAAIGFSRDSDRYHRGRPTYHPEIAGRVAERYGQGVVVELGAGTGIFTRQLVDLGVNVVALEPRISMRTLLMEAVPEADIRVGAAEKIPLTADSVNAVVASQSFHWFDFGAALEEIDRVVRVGGHLVTVWNVRDESAKWVARYGDVMDRYVGDAPRYRTMSWRRAINADPRFAPVDEWRVANVHHTDAAGVIDRALSTSYISALPQEKQDEVAAEIDKIVGPLGAEIEFPYISQLQAWRTITP